MRTSLLSLAILSIFVSSILASCNRSKPADNSEKAKVSENGYNDSLAKALQADSFGMKAYVLALLYAGPNRTQDSATVERIQSAHLKNIMRLAKEGKMSLAGPILADTTLRGIFVFNVSTVEEAKALLATDSAIATGRLRADMYPWYGPATLQQIMDMQRRVEKRNIME